MHNRYIAVSTSDGISTPYLFIGSIFMAHINNLNEIQWQCCAQRKYFAYKWQSMAHFQSEFSPKYATFIWTENIRILFSFISKLRYNSFGSSSGFMTQNLVLINTYLWHNSISKLHQLSFSLEPNRMLSGSFFGVKYGFSRNFSSESANSQIE